MAMRNWYLLVGVTAGLLCANAAQAQLSQDREWCSEKSGTFSVEMLIAGCTGVIQSGEKDAANLARAFNNRGAANNEKGQYDTAIEDLSQAIRLDPKYAHAFYNRGNAYDHKGQLDRAIEDYTQAIRLDPKFAVAFRNRGNAYNHEGQHDSAIEDDTQAIRLEPENAENFNSRCWSRAIAGRDLDKALSDCNESLRLKPNVANTLDSRGMVHLKLRQYDRAFKDYSDAIAINAKAASALYGRGYARKQQGDNADAMADMAAAKEIQPDVEQTYAKYGIK
jgi:tetratricopeptide (TPR) repeat protein